MTPSPALRLWLSLPVLVPALVALLGLGVAGCGTGRAGRAGGGGSAGSTHAIAAVGAESQYANVISQVGGRFVSVSAIMDSPSVDPHAFEVSPQVARTIARARLVVQNGLGYDGFMNKVESATGTPSRRIVDVQRLLRLPDSTRNPHLWYDPDAMVAVARAAAGALAAVEPEHAGYFRARARAFIGSLRPLQLAIGAFRARHAGAPVATTEPVADYLLQAAGLRNRTAWNLQADLMNGVDPAPQDLTAETDLLRHHRVRALVYNRQVTDTVTQSFLQQAAQNHVPVVAVYETMPSGYSYQSWMLAELRALARAVAGGRSTRSLP